jgi:long-chain acyl-CoA synthetase
MRQEKKLISGSREISRNEIDRQTRLAASGLAAAGVGEGDTLAVMMRNDAPFMVATLAAATLKAMTTPVNWHFTAEETSWILTNSEAKVLVVHADLWRNIGPQIAANVLEGLTVIAVPVEEDIAKTHRLPPEVCSTPEGTIDWQTWLLAQTEWRGDGPQPQSAMIYTSGTTGRPKGVRREGVTAVTKKGNHGSFVEEARLLLATPLYHSAPNRAALSTWFVGGEIVLRSKFDAEETLQLIEQYSITHSFMVPTMLIRLLKLPKEVRDKYDVSSLKHVVHAGAHCPPDVKRAIIEWWGPVLFEYYGGTETGAVTYCTSEEALAHPGTVGRAVADATIRILDDAGNDCPTGTPGEIFCRLHSIPDFTYQGNHEARLEIEQHGLVTCGDIGYLDEEGYLFLSDRKNDMVISGGVNIYPAEIEAALFAHEDVHDCAVFGLPDEEFGEQVVAAILPEQGIDLDEDKLKTFLRQKIAGYMLPRRFIQVNELPRDDNGKVFKRKLRDMYR